MYRSYEKFFIVEEDIDLVREHCQKGSVSLEVMKY